jgi:hypothetical protein
LTLKSYYLSGVLFVVHACLWFSSKLKWRQSWTEFELSISLILKTILSANIKIMIIHPPQESIQVSPLEGVPPQVQCTHVLFPGAHKILSSKGLVPRVWNYWDVVKPLGGRLSERNWDLRNKDPPLSASQLERHHTSSFALSHVPHHYMLSYHKSQSNRANQLWTEPSEIVSQNETFLFFKLTILGILVQWWNQSSFINPNRYI